MADRLQAEFARQLNCLVGARVIDEHDLVNDLLVKFSYGTCQRGGGVIGGQHYADPATI